MSADDAELEAMFKAVASRRCKCTDSEVEEIEGVPNCLRCTTCGGWFALRVGTKSELEMVRNTFK